MILITNKSDCCGCTACAMICNSEAITMTDDAMGFKYPVVDESKCTNCGLCDRVCAFQNGYDTSSNFNEQLIYAARHKDANELFLSQSGGASAAICKSVINQSGVVYGCVLDDTFTAIHKRCTTLEECEDLRGSKYVQSDLNNVFSYIRDDLKAGKLVLFTGTSCQTSGLKSYIPKKLHENLILCDIICHGVPSPKIWSDYTHYISNKYNKEIKGIKFRDKAKGWKSHVESFTFTDNTKIFSTSYTSLFYSHIMLRPSCGECRYTNYSRASDITIADFWGIEKVSDTFAADNKGCSVIMINTVKGETILNSISSEFNVLKSNKQECVQPNLCRPSVINSKSDKFEHDFEKHGFEYILNHYGNIGWRYQCKRAVRLIYRITLKRIIAVIKK